MIKSANVNGVRLAYEDVGAGERPFVLVHGFTGSRDDFREHMPALARLGRTIAYDNRGHGDSTNTSDASTYSFEQLAGDLGALLDHLEIARSDLLGHSMGGMVALRYALAHPERVASLILMDTAARPPDAMPRAAFAAGGAIARSDGMKTLAALMRARARDDPRRPAASLRVETEMGPEVFWERQRRKIEAMDPKAFAVLGLLLADQEPVTHRLGEIDCPTLIVVGAEDVGFLGPARELEQGIRGSRLVTIADAAHSPQLENPRAWFEAVADHLRRCRAERGR